MASTSKIITTLLMILLMSNYALTQSRNNTRTLSTVEGSVISVTAKREKGSEPISLKEVFLYENSIEQRLRNFSFDPSPARIVVLVDNSQSLRTELEALRNAVLEFAYEIYDGDQLFVIGYDETAEIIQEWTDDAENIRKSTQTFRLKGNPFLFDALSAASREVLVPLMPGLRKTAIVMITDGLDRGSKTSYQQIIRELQLSDVTVYAIQLPDRTNGAFRRNQPKAPAVIKGITEATGGSVYQFTDVQQAAKAICDELKNNRYLLSYLPMSQNIIDDRSLFVLGQEGITIRSKTNRPGRGQ
jgi:Ca-activated chloride channel family protein